MSAGPEISVVVPARNAAAGLPRLFESLAAQTFPREGFEVIVVDNASRDGTADVARARGARVVREPRPNRALARNRGVREATAPLVAFTDADCAVDRGWLAALVGCLERVPLAGGPVRVEVGEPPNAIERFERLWRFPQERYVRKAGYAASANLGVRREALEATGGFDPAYRRIGEDVDLCLRARGHGFAIGWCPDAVVSHPAESRLRPVLRRGFVQGYSAHQLERRLDGRAGRRYWPHPRALVRGDWGLRHLGVEPGELEPAERRTLLRIGRLEYAARMTGSTWAAVTRAR